MIKTGRKGLRTKNPDFMREVVHNVMDNLMSDAKKVVAQYTPKDTGLARRSWQLKGNKRKLINQVDYITALEAGHSKQRRTGISTPSLKKIDTKYKKGTYDE